MKKIQLILLLLICAKVSAGQQLTLTGTVNGAAKHNSIEVNVPYDGEYWKKKSVYLKPDRTGSFHISFPYHTEKFIILTYKEGKQCLLLSPGRPLRVNINVDKPRQMFTFRGKAKTENDLMKKLKLEDERNLSFIKELKSKNSYANWSVDSVINIKRPMIMHSLDSIQQLVYQAALPLSLKKAIATEVKYFYANAVSQNIGNLLNNRKNRISFNTHFIDAVLSDFKIPTKDELNISTSANLYLDSYFRYKLWKTVYDYRTDKNKEHADSIFTINTGVSYKDLENDPDRTNEVYLFSTRMKTIMPPYAWEKHLTNLLFNFCMSGQLQSAAKLLLFIKANCTNRRYITASERMFAPLMVARDQYANNLNIKIRPDYKNISSLKTLLAPYKGKVVFIDMWGTWCPHCIEDMVFEPALKDRLKGKDIVFLYIARDEDKDDEAWRDFIFINNLTGEHVRRTADQIAPLWNELGIIDSKQAYPHYFIIDKSGNILVNNAKRPDDDDALYNQLVQTLGAK
ncbi:TlpA family protein disulfide reductase [Mucilaginibacter sp. BJC16-A38]|uniref:TlpA family protein disulfide reductase n=1 Tax=Mucilaginibacter phenanthrenivorans TaxID=1234842 RepID=UPI0021577FDD|nr:TlpA disulfide reductase family protein [Mucilaginibacter phenanthrenivorans]MCR8556391.1 TlpA family protein disulfide reductase [Mucilaginibacter phenanthrenivorans]